MAKKKQKQLIREFWCRADGGKEWMVMRDDTMQLAEESILDYDQMQAYVCPGLPLYKWNRDDTLEVVVI